MPNVSVKAVKVKRTARAPCSSNVVLGGSLLTVAVKSGLLSTRTSGFFSTHAASAVGATAA